MGRDNAGRKFGEHDEEKKKKLVGFARHFHRDLRIGLFDLSILLFGHLTGN